MRPKHVSLALLLLLLLTGCGSGGETYYTTSSVPASRGALQTFGRALSPNEQARVAQTEARLISNVWVGLDEKYRPRNDTFLTLRRLTPDPGSNQSRFRFELYAQGEYGLQGHTKMVSERDGVVEGVIDSPSGHCIAPLSVESTYSNLSTRYPAYSYRPDRIGTDCHNQASWSYIGSHVYFQNVSSDVGPALSVELRRPNGFGHDSGSFLFQPANEIAARLSAKK